VTEGAAPVRLTAVPGRLDAAVAAGLGVSRAVARRLVESGAAVVDGRDRPPSHRLAGNEVLEVLAPGEDRLEAEPGPLAVRYEDEALLVVSKPAGLVTHPTPARRTGTLVNRLLGAGVSLAPAGGPDRPGVVHRLDVGTSGLLVVAKTDPAYEALRALFARHEAERAYLALVRGSPRFPQFLIDAALGREGPKVRVRAGSGRSASTEVDVREELQGATLVEARPRTGRTHQIRVHLAAVGHPVLGDRAYGGWGEDSVRLGLSRPFLHSWRIRFDHPLTGRPVEVEDGLPDDLAAALSRARSG
jgi:23S rRNA pseudouridine1911/1915/1917 synthase